MPLNKLLYENKHGMNYIFDRWSEFTPGWFDKQHLEQFVEVLFKNEKHLMPTPQKLHELFVYS